MRGFIFIFPYVCMVALFIFFLLTNDKRIAPIGVLIFIIVLVIYYLKAIIDALIIWKRDKDDGDQEAILEYLDTYSRLPSGGSKGGFAPGCISASFRIDKMFSEDKYNLTGEIVSLSGDIKNYNFIKGGKYKATMRLHSKKLINIKDLEFNGDLYE